MSPLCRTPTCGTLQAEQRHQDSERNENGISAAGLRAENGIPGSFRGERKLSKRLRFQLLKAEDLPERSTSITDNSDFDAVSWAVSEGATPFPVQFVDIGY